MSNHENENTNKNCSDEYGGMEERELLAQALLESLSSKVDKISEEAKDSPISKLSKKDKRRMNRLFRERVDSGFLPYPEADTTYERIRSKLIVTLKINEILDFFNEC